MVEQKIPLQYFLVSTHRDLKEQIEKIKSKPTAFCDKTQLESCVKPQAEIIFDSEYIDYKSVILKMEKYKDVGATFKIAHPKSAFAIGSNSSNDRGEVILLADYR